MSIPSLHNRYFLMRHGTAQSNIEQRYSTDPELGQKQHPLVPEGRQLVKNSIVTSAPLGLDEHTIIYASPFLRTTQTAQIVQEFLGCPQITFDLRLRERFCGDFDGKVYTYPSPHRQADTKIDSDFRGVESLSHMWDRLYGVIRDIEKKHRHQTILIVSHGDPLDCLYCGLHGVDLLRFHDHFPNFQRGEIRLLF